MKQYSVINTCKGLIFSTNNSFAASLCPYFFLTFQSAGLLDSLCRCSSQSLTLTTCFTRLSVTPSVVFDFSRLTYFRLRLKCDGTRAETRFRLSAKRTCPFKSAGASVQSPTGSRGVRISGRNAWYTMFRSSVKSTGYPLHSPVSPSLPLLCVTVCRHISTGLYQHLTAMPEYCVALSQLTGNEQT
jgi:hypothetical protein